MHGTTQQGNTSLSFLHSLIHCTYYSTCTHNIHLHDMKMFSTLVLTRGIGIGAILMYAILYFRTGGYYFIQHPQQLPQHDYSPKAYWTTTSPKEQWQPLRYQEGEENGGERT